jgi:hypothetical protein
MYVNIRKMRFNIIPLSFLYLKRHAKYLGRLILGSLIALLLKPWLKVGAVKTLILF